MSLVGTRPPTVDEWELYEPHHRARMSFRPGLTGMWQVSGRSNITDFEEVVKLDTQEKVNVCKAIQGIEERGRAAGRSEGIQIGAEHEQRLTKSLLKDNRIDDLKRALDDPAFRQKLLEEYGID